VIDPRWMIRPDMPRVLEIDGASFDAPWFESDYIGRLRQRNHIGMVIERDERVVGCMVYSLHKGQLQIVRLAVDVAWRRQGIGRQLVQRLLDKLVSSRRRMLTVTVPETWFEALCFFRAIGLQAVRMNRGEFGDEDGIVIEWERAGDVREFDAEEDGECEAVG
jgi:[ribosomal protein S18]-alanine N-acetyltransferase